MIKTRILVMMCCEQKYPNLVVDPYGLKVSLAILLADIVYIDLNLARRDKPPRFFFSLGNNQKAVISSGAGIPVLSYGRDQQN